MKKSVFILLFAIVASSSVSFAQTLQTYQGDKFYHSLMDFIVSGTEKYSFSVGEHGERLLQNNYSFTGDFKYDDDDKHILSKYSVTSTCKNNRIHGAYSAKGTIVVKRYHYFRGWETTNYSSSFSGAFDNGKPNGLFSIVIDGNALVKGSTSLKNGQYFGTYNLQDIMYSLSGQLTTNGKLTGKWIEKTSGNTYNYIFENDVLIQETNSNGKSTPPAVQSVAKQFAAGKISKDDIEKKGFIVVTRTLPLNRLLDNLILRDEDVTGLQEFPGSWDLSGFGAKQYTAIIQLNIISDEGLNRIIKEIERTHQVDAVYREEFDCRGSRCETFCNSTLHYDASSNAFYMQCGQKFNQLYGYYHESYSTALEGLTEIYLTNKQCHVLDSVKNNVFIESAHDFAEIFNGYKREIDNLGKLYSIYRNNPDDLPNKLLVTRTNNKIEDLWKESVEKYENYIKKLGKATSLYYIKDSTYIIDLTGYEKCAWKNEFATWYQFNEALRNAFIKADSLSIIQKELYSKLSSNNVSGVVASIINRDRALYRYGKAEYLTTAYNNISETQDLVRKAESVEVRHEQILANVPDKLLKKYKKEYKKVTSIRASDTSIQPDQYKSLFADISNLQNSIIAYNEHLQNTEKLNTDITMKCNSYSDILKAWKQKYKLATTMTDDINQCTETLKETQCVGQKLLTYISKRQEYDSLSVQISNKCGKAYGDVSKAYQTKVKGEKVVPDMTSIETMNQDYASLMEYASYQEQLLQYIQNRQKVDKLNSGINEKISKAKNLKKSYGSFYKSLPIVWSAEFDNFKTIEEIIASLEKIDSALQANGVDGYDEQLKKTKTVDDFKAAFNL